MSYNRNAYYWWAVHSLHASFLFVYLFTLVVFREKCFPSEQSRNLFSQCSLFNTLRAGCHRWVYFKIKILFILLCFPSLSSHTAIGKLFNRVNGINCWYFFQEKQNFNGIEFPSGERDEAMWLDMLYPLEIIQFIYSQLKAVRCIVEKGLSGRSVAWILCFRFINCRCAASSVFSSKHFPKSFHVFRQFGRPVDTFPPKATQKPNVF